MLTMREAAALMAEWLNRDAFPQSTIRSWIFKGKLASYSVGKKVYVEEKDLKKFLPIRRG